MAKELVTREELETELRAHGITDIRHVEVAYMEGNGVITATPLSEPEGTERTERTERTIRTRTSTHRRREPRSAPTG